MSESRFPEDTIEPIHPFGAQTATAIHRGLLYTWDALTEPMVALYNYAMGIDAFWEGVERMNQFWRRYDAIRTPSKGTASKSAAD